MIKEKLFSSDWLIFILATVAAAVVWHLADQAVDKIEGSAAHGQQGY